MAALWIGYEEAEQLRELLEGIASDQHAASRERSLAQAAATRVHPSMPDEDLADVASLLTTAARVPELDTTWREAARYWASQVEEWLRPRPGAH